MRPAGEDLPPGWEGVAALCRGADGRSLLMVLQGRPGQVPTWAVPGGSIAPGETPEQAAIREVKEETGLDVRIVGPHAVFRCVRDDGAGPLACQVHYFEVQVVGGEARACDPDGLIHRVAWVPAARLSQLRLTHEDQRQILMAFVGAS